MTEPVFEEVMLSLESVDERDGKFYFTAKSLTNEFECEPVLERLARDSVNKHLIWRHKHPIQDENHETHIYGTVRESKVVDGYIQSKYEVFNHTQDHRDFIELIKEKSLVNDPLGISMRYRKYFKNGNINHVDVFEHSSTPYPKCEKCLNFDEYIGEKDKMSEQTEPVKKQDKEEDKELEQEDLSKHLERIEELQATLDSRTETLEEYKSKIETLEKEIKDAKESKQAETMTLEDRVKVLEEKLEKQEIKHKEEIEMLEKQPILDEMFELKDLDDAEKKFYKKQKKTYLEEKLETWNKEVQSKPVTEDMADNVDKAMEKDQEEKEEISDKINEEDIEVMCTDPRIKSIIKKHMLKKKE